MLEKNVGLRAQKTASAGPAECFELSSDEGRPAGGSGRRHSLLEARPQKGVQRHVVEHLFDLAPMVQILDAPVPQSGEQLADIFKLLDTQRPVEQVIDVPKFSQDVIHLRHPQMAEQLVDVPTVLSYSFIQQQPVEQNVDIPVPGARGSSGYGGLQGFHPGQSSSLSTDEQIVSDDPAESSSPPAARSRPDRLVGVRPQERVQGHTVEQIGGGAPCLPSLDVPVPQMGKQLLEVCRLLDSALPEQLIDVPKISQWSIQQRLVNRDLRLLQVAEQLVEVPTILYFLKQPIAEQIMDIPVPRGRGGSGDGGLQGFHPGQGSQRTAEQLVDIPVPGAGLHDSLPGPELAASSAVSRDELGQCFFLHLSPKSKSAESAGSSSARVHGDPR